MPMERSPLDFEIRNSNNNKKKEERKTSQFQSVVNMAPKEIGQFKEYWCSERSNCLL